LIAGALFALWVVRLPALQQPPAALWYLFVCGVIAICAMILPGISGAFLLVILGKYHELTGIIKQIPKLAVTGHDLLQIAVFAAGCAVGLLSFSRLLKWLLTQHYAITMATLTGFMLGSLYKIWPFQRDLTPELPFKEKLFELLPWEAIPANLATGVTLLLMLGGLLGVILLESVARRFVPATPATPPSA
jgi:putative membrane protein